jgi:hypothetical protein
MHVKKTYELCTKFSSWVAADYFEFGKNIVGLIFETKNLLKPVGRNMLSTRRAKLVMKNRIKQGKKFCRYVNINGKRTMVLY